MRARVADLVFSIIYSIIFDCDMAISGLGFLRKLNQPTNGSSQTICTTPTNSIRASRGFRIPRRGHSKTVGSLSAAGLLLVLLLFGVAGWGQQPVSLEVPVKGPFEFIAYGDVRFTNPANSAPSNPEYRRALVTQIASIKPSFVLFSGDLVLRGDNPADWADLDETKPWADAKLKFFPTIGNHELAKDEASGLRNYLQHFPELKDSRYYSVRAGNTLTLVLDSSQDEASGTQGQWLASQLDHLPGNIDFVFFLLHHPPYTRSREGFLGGAATRRAPASRRWQKCWKNGNPTPARALSSSAAMSITTSVTSTRA